MHEQQRSRSLQRSGPRIFKPFERALPRRGLGRATLPVMDGRLRRHQNALQAKGDKPWTADLEVWRLFSSSKQPPRCHENGPIWNGQSCPGRGCGHRR